MTNVSAVICRLLCETWRSHGSECADCCLLYVMSYILV